MQINTIQPLNNNNNIHLSSKKRNFSNYIQKEIFICDTYTKNINFGSGKYTTILNNTQKDTVLTNELITSGRTYIEKLGGYQAKKNWLREEKPITAKIQGQTYVHRISGRDKPFEQITIHDKSEVNTIPANTVNNLILHDNSIAYHVLHTPNIELKDNSKIYFIYSDEHAEEKLPVISLHDNSRIMRVKTDNGFLILHQSDNKNFPIVQEVENTDTLIKSGLVCNYKGSDLRIHSGGTIGTAIMEAGKCNIEPILFLEKGANIKNSVTFVSKGIVQIPKDYDINEIKDKIKGDFDIKYYVPIMNLTVPNQVIYIPSI